MHSRYLTGQVSTHSCRASNFIGITFFFIFSATYSYTVTQTEAKNEILINRIIRFVSYFFVSSPCLSFIRISRSSLRSVDRSSCEGTTLAFEKSFVFSPNLTTSGKTSGVQLKSEIQKLADEGELLREREKGKVHDVCAVRACISLTESCSRR